MSQIREKRGCIQRDGNRRRSQREPQHQSTLVRLRRDGWTCGRIAGLASGAGTIQGGPVHGAAPNSAPLLRRQPVAGPRADGQPAAVHLDPDGMETGLAHAGGRDGPLGSSPRCCWSDYGYWRWSSSSQATPGSANFAGPSPRLSDIGRRRKISRNIENQLRGVGDKSADGPVGGWHDGHV